MKQSGYYRLSDALSPVMQSDRVLFGVERFNLDSHFPSRPASTVKKPNMLTRQVDEYVKLFYK